MCISRTFIGLAMGSLLLMGCSSQNDQRNELSVSGLVSDVNCVGSGFVSVAQKDTIALLSQEIPGWLLESGVPSVSISTVKDGALGWSLACGNHRPNKSSTLDTLYNTASIAKPIVGELALRLASDGDLLLDEPMSKYWIDPDVVEDHRHNLLTPRIALAHQTGFKNWRRMSDGVLSFQWKPGTRRGYSGEGIRYLARFLEKKFNMPFEELARARLLVPLGASDASFVTEDWFGDRVAFRKTGPDQWAEPLLNDEPQGAGHLWISSKDYARLLVGVLDNDAISKSYQEIRTQVSIDEVSERCDVSVLAPFECPAEMGFGVGWYVHRFKDELFVVHTGADYGNRSLAMLNLTKRSGLVVFANGENGKQVIGNVARSIGADEATLRLQGLKP